MTHLKIFRPKGTSELQHKLAKRNTMIWWSFFYWNKTIPYLCKKYELDRRTIRGIVIQGNKNHKKIKEEKIKKAMNL